MLHLKTLSPVALDLVSALCAHPAMHSFALCKAILEHSVKSW